LADREGADLAGQSVGARAKERNKYSRDQLTAMIVESSAHST
jgi:hypothetical protein